MKIRLYLLVCFILLYVTVQAQMKIGDNSTSINSASLLELETTNKGLVFPRVSLTSVSSSSPLAATLLTGTVVFNTNASVTNGNGVGLYYWNGSAWSIVTPNISSSAWSLTGNSGTSASTNFIGTTDAIDFVTKTNNLERLRITSGGNVGIRTSTPASDLTLYQSSGSGSSKGFTFTGNSIGGTSSGTGILMSLGYNASGNKQLWIGDADYAGSVSGSFARFGVSGTSFPVLDAISGNNVSRRYLALGVAGDANSGVIFGSDNTGVNPGSQVWDNGNMTIGSGYKSSAAPSNGLLVQGNVGIGTTNPGYVLSVLAASNPLYLSGVQATSTFTTDSVLTINAGVVKKAPYASLTSNFWSLTGNAGTSASTNFIGTTDAIDFVAKTNNTERIHILGAANGVSKEGWIGMGVSVPRSSLDVTGNYTNKNVITVQNTSSSGYSSVDMLDNTGALVGTFGYGNSGTGAFFGSRDYFSIYGHDFVLNTNSGNYDFFLKGSNGYLGLNTNTPSERLHLVGNFYLNGAFMPGGSAGTSGYVLTSAGANTSPTWTSSNNFAWGITGNTGTNSSTNFIGTTDAIDFVSKTNNTERMRVTSGGNVGINTSSPGSTLDVKGTLRLSGSSSGYVALAPAAAAGSTTYTLPAADGTAGQALTTDGSGNLSWAVAAATIGTIGTGATIQGTATGKYYCTGSYITLPPGKFIVNVYMMLSSSPAIMNQTTANQPGSFFIKSFFADASFGTVAGTTVSPPLPQSDVSPDVVGNGKLISGSLSVGQTYNPISGFVVINNTSGANKSYYYWAGWVSLTNVLSTNSLPLIGGTNYGEDNIVAYPTN